jgi:Ca2+-binding EF-hand superfamily protein
MDMNKTTQWLLTGSALAIFANLAVAEDKPEGRRERGPMGQHEGRPEGGPEHGRFEAIDTDGDGLISQAELQNHFKGLDANGDNLVSKEEMKAHMMAQMAKNREAGPEERMKKMDSNGDGVISKDEFKGPKEFFTKIDTNQDGQIDATEVQEAKKKMAEHMGDKRPNFEEQDTNKDGFVDKSEFKGPAEMFSRLDGNGDTLISKEELEAAKEKMKSFRDRDGEHQGKGERKGPRPEREKTEEL